MQFKHTLVAAALTAGFMGTACAHEITFALGGSSATLNAEQEFIDTTPGSGIDVHSTGNDTVLGGEFAAGYVWNVNSGFDIGFEFFYDFVSGLEVIAPSGESTTVDNIWGLRAKPAFRITNNTKIYIDLGYAIIDQTLDISNVVGLSGFSATSAESKNQGGFQYGAGIETMIYNTIGIRLAYDVQQSAELSLDSDDGIESFTSTPTVYTFFFGATYHFQF